MKPRLILLIPIVLLGCVAVALMAATASGMFRPRPEPALIGGPFQLVDQDGRAVDESLLDGKWSAVFFGFTYCPDVCPTTLTTLGSAQEKLGRRAGRLQIVFVSVDPDRDTPEQVKAYLSTDGFPKGAIGLTGSEAQVAAVAKAYRVYYRKAGEGENYLVDHSTPAYLMDPKGRFAAVLRYGMSPDETAAEIARAMGGR